MRFDAWVRIKKDMSALAPDRLLISEIFESVQGEGPSVGVPSIFLRLGLCNLKCTFCDTPFTWDFQRFDRENELESRGLEELVESLEAFRSKNLVVTGGEPLLQDEALVALLARLPRHRVEVESAATRMPSEALLARVDQWNLSPKLAGSGNAERHRIKPEVLSRFAALSHASFKFVIAEEGDLEEVDALVERFSIPPGRVILMPEGVSDAVLIRRGRELVERAIERGFRYGHRLHITLYGDERGR